MSKTRVVHLHIPGDFEGEIHVHVLPVDAPTTSLPDNGSGAMETSAVGKILERFENHDPATAARDVHSALVTRGWQAYAPTSKTGDASKAPYIRLVYKGSHRTVSVFLNTVSLVYARKDASQLAARIDNAEMHLDGSMYLYHSEGRTREALDAMALLERWADGLPPAS